MNAWHAFLGPRIASTAPPRVVRCSSFLGLAQCRSVDSRHSWLKYAPTSSRLDHQQPKGRSQGAGASMRRRRACGREEPGTCLAADDNRGHSTRLAGDGHANSSPATQGRERPVFGGWLLLSTVPLVWGTYAPSVKYLYDVGEFNSLGDSAGQYPCSCATLSSVHHERTVGACQMRQFFTLSEAVLVGSALL